MSIRAGMWPEVQMDDGLLDVASQLFPIGAESMSHTVAHMRNCVASKPVQVEAGFSHLPRPQSIHAGEGAP